MLVHCLLVVALIGFYSVVWYDPFYVGMLLDTKPNQPADCAIATAVSERIVMHFNDISSLKLEHCMLCAVVCK